MAKIDNNNIVEELRKARSFAVSLAREVDVKNQMLCELERKYDETSATLSKVMAEKHELQQAYDQEENAFPWTGKGKYEVRFGSASEKDWDAERKLRKELACMQEKLESQAKKDKKQSQDDLNSLNLLVEKDKLKTQEIEELSRKLAEKIDEIQDMEALNQALIIREHTSNQELQDARKELISVFATLLGGETVGVKRVGEIDDNAFKTACLRRLCGNEWKVKSLELTSLWQAKVNDPSWQPFKKMLKDGKASYISDMQEVIDAEDSKLKELRSQWGEAVYNAVANALLEVNEYNPSGRYAASELWISKEGRKASLKEAIQCLTQQLKSLNALKRRRGV